MPITPKNWINNDPSTPLDRAGLQDMEVRVSSYADALGGRYRGEWGDQLVSGAVVKKSDWMTLSGSIYIANTNYTMLGSTFSTQSSKWDKLPYNEEGQAMWPELQYAARGYVDQTKLTWAPPPITAPTTDNIVIHATGTAVFNGDWTKHAEVTSDAVHTNGTFNLIGYRSARITGVSLVGPVPMNVSATQDWIFIQGCLVDIAALAALGNIANTFTADDGINAYGKHTGGVDLSHPDVYLQDCFITGMVGSELSGDRHGDAYQPTGPIRNLMMDRVTWETTYQGPFLSPADGMSGSITMFRCNGRGLDIDYWADTLSPGFRQRFSLWLPTYNIGTDAPPVTVRDVWIAPTTGKTVSQNHLWPAAGQINQDGLAVGNYERLDLSSAFPTTVPISGRVMSGAPPGGDFAPRASMGFGYVNPGYLNPQGPAGPTGPTGPAGETMVSYWDGTGATPARPAGSGPKIFYWPSNPFTAGVAITNDLWWSTA